MSNAILDPKPGDSITVGAETWHVTERIVNAVAFRSRIGTQWSAQRLRLTLAQWQEAAGPKYPPIELWPTDLIERFHERAAIREFDGGMTREDAEVAAMDEVWRGR